MDRNAVWPSVLEAQSDIKLVDGTSKRGVGKFCSGVHNIGLALMRLEHIQNDEKSFTSVKDESVRLRPFLPEWWTEEKL